MLDVYSSVLVNLPMFLSCKQKNDLLAILLLSPFQILTKTLSILDLKTLGVLVSLSKALPVAPPNTIILRFLLLRLPSCLSLSQIQLELTSLLARRTWCCPALSMKSSLLSYYHLIHLLAGPIATYLTPNSKGMVFSIPHIHHLSPSSG